MAEYLGKSWTREELLGYIGDIKQICGASLSVLSDGKSEGVKVIRVNTGGALSFDVLPGRGMDIAGALYEGTPLNFLSATGITSPAYYEEPGVRWLRSFYGGLLTTCGITNAGAPGSDRGEEFGLHGRMSNAAAEDIGIIQEWLGDEYAIRLRGVVREAQAMGENIALVRTIETKLGRRGFTLHDVVENRGFAPQPLMMLYHCNYGFPLLGPDARVIGPVLKTAGRDEEANSGGGTENYHSFPEPQERYGEKVYFHDLAADDRGRTFISLVNESVGGKTQPATRPLGVVMRFSKKELPALTEWKMPAKGFYVVGLEPGTMTPMGRGVLRESGKLLLLDGQQSYSITVDFDVIDTASEIEELEKEANRLTG